MGSFQPHLECEGPTIQRPRKPLVVVGITHPQTGLVFKGRLRALREAGFRVVLIASPGPLLQRIAVQEGVEAWPLPMERRIAPFADILAFARLCRALLILHPDIAEFSTPKAGMLGSVAAFVCRVPCRIYVLRGLRLETARGLKKLILRASETLASACSHYVLCNSPSLLKKAQGLGIAHPGKLKILGEGSSGGVDIERFLPRTSDLRKTLGIGDQESVIGFVGRITRDKGIPDLIEAFDDLRRTRTGVRLLLVGWYDDSEDSIPKKLRDYIDAHPAITQTGFVEDPAPFYRIMDVMVLPTFREGFPNVALEAAASGIPVITTLATGSRDAVIPKVTGLLVLPGSPAVLSAAMGELVSDPERCRRMGTAARAWVTKHYQSTTIHERTIEFYRNMLTEPQHQARATAFDEPVAALDERPEIQLES